MKAKLDNIWIGILIGLLGALIGFLLFTFGWTLIYDSDFKYFIEEVFLGSGIFRDKIITVSVLFDVLLFAIFMRMNWYEMCKGILAVVIVSVPVIIYFY